MKKIVLSLIILFMTFTSYSAQEFAEDIFVREHWISLTKSYDIRTKSYKLGSLHKRVFSLLLTYDFYNPDNVNTLTAKARFFTLGAHLDLYNPDNQIVGSVEEKLFNFFPTFVLYASDSSTKLARAVMNFWGTKFYINDPETGREMAIMSRSFIRMKNNWIIHVTDPLRLKQKNIDPRVLMTVLAVQGEIEDWSQQSLNTYLKSSKDSQKKPVNQLPPVLAALTQEKSQITQILKPEQLEMLVNEIEEGFRVSSQQTEELSNDERIQAFSMYCENLLKSPDLPQDKKEAIQTLLNLRLYGHP
jgi:hypothetical protein